MRDEQNKSRPSQRSFMQFDPTLLTLIAILSIRGKTLWLVSHHIRIRF